MQSYAENIAGNAPLSMIAAKRVIDEYVKDPEKRNHKMADDAVAACFTSAGCKEGRKAFMKKRKPVWQGKLHRRTAASESEAPVPGNYACGVVSPVAKTGTGNVTLKFFSGIVADKVRCHSP